MAITDLINSIILNDRFSDTFDRYDRRLTGSGQATNQFGRTVASAAASITVAAGAVGGVLVAIDRLTDAAVQNQAAMFNVQAAAAAANTEFGDSVGTVESWSNAVVETSDRLRVFGDRDVANATARLVDMTKRLGLTEAQMRTVLIRTGDVAAGKTTLADGVERVTAALRGEAEAAEFLSLSLNETVVRNYAESLGLVFKELSDSEKAQLRYELFLQQTEALQGRAAQSAKTLAGAEAELARLRERQITELGQNLLPLRQGEIELYKELTSANLSFGEVALKVQSAIQAALVSTGILINQTIEGIEASVNILSAALTALWNRDLESAQAALTAIDEGRKSGEKLLNVVSNLGDVFSETYAQLLEGNRQAIDAQIQLIDGQQRFTEKVEQTGDIAVVAADEVAAAYEKLEKQQLTTATRFNQRIEQAEFDHAQRLARLHQDLQTSIAESAATAAADRIAAANDLAGDIADIERDLAADRAQAELSHQSDLRRISEQREDIERDLARDLDRLARESRDSRLDIERDYQDDLLRLEQDFARQRQGINDDFEREFAEADPFRRQILEFNREEALSQLDQQEKDEKAALESQKNTALTELESRIAEEQKLLEEDAKLKKERLDRERRDLEDHFALEQAQRDEAARLSIEKLQQQHQEELARIDQQEQAKIERAQEAIDRENQNHADRLASLQFANQQEIAAVEEKYNQLLAAQEFYQDQSKAEAEKYIADLNRIMAGGGFGPTGPVSQGGPTPGNGTVNYNSVVVHNNGGGDGFAGAQQTARSVVDALQGF